MTLLPAMLGALLCSLAVSSEVAPQADLNLQEVAGKWHLIGVATNARWFVNRKAGMKMGTAVLAVTAGGDLDMSYASLNSDGSCWRMSNLAKKTDVPGKFTYTSWKKLNDMCIVDVKYDEYALVHTVRSKDSDPTATNKLYGRDVDLRADLLERFRQFSLETGVLPENIAFLPKSAECPDA
ncbi:lipocalin [Spinachia spinachia]